MLWGYALGYRSNGKLVGNNERQWERHIWLTGFSKLAECQEVQ